MEIDDLKEIKKHYGENMMHLCRELFSTILEEKGRLFQLISQHFEYSRTLYDDIVNHHLQEEFKDYIYSFIDVEQDSIATSKTPAELLDMANYDLFECHSESEIQSFRKYYEPHEELCTFTFGGRLHRCFVFFAVKKDVDKIIRSDFTKPDRQDRYGTSVISIQFTRGNNNTVSIKNRYNHSVNNPDATFGNNLDNIIPGLTYAFNKTYNLNITPITRYFDLHNYVLTNEGKYIKYNSEVNGVYYCRDNIIYLNGQVKRYDKQKYIVMDYFILDKVNKEITLLDSSISDSFIKSIGRIERIEEFVDKSTKDRKVLINSNIEILLDRDNRIISYVNKNVEEIGNNFMYYNRWMQNIDIPNATRVGKGFLRNNNCLKTYDFSNIKTVGDDFLLHNKGIEDLSMPNLISTGKQFLGYIFHLNSINLPKLQIAGDDFLFSATNIGEKIEFPNLEEVGDSFLDKNTSLVSFSAPKLRHIGDIFISLNKKIHFIDLPELEELGHNFLSNNESILELYLPKIRAVGRNFLHKNKIIKRVFLPSVIEIKSNFLHDAEELISVDLPNVDFIDNNFLVYCRSLGEIILPNVNIIGNNFLYSCKNIKKVIMPNVGSVGHGFLTEANNITELYIPNIIVIDDEDFLSSSPEELRNKYKDKFISLETSSSNKRKR